MGGFTAEVRECTRASDVALIFAVPAVLTAAYLLPESIRADLVLDYAEPSLIAAWSSAYVHRSFGHFANNLGAYFVAVVPIYLLLALADERRLFRAAFLGFVLVLPPALALVNVAVLGRGTGAGFSGIGSAFIGLLPVALLVFVGKRFSSSIDPTDGVGLFLVAAGAVALTYVGTATAAGIFVIAGALAVYSALDVGIEEVRRVSVELSRRDGEFELVLLAIALFLVSPALLFPAELVRNGSAVNVLSHYAGLIAGYFGPTSYVTFR